MNLSRSAKNNVGQFFDTLTNNSHLALGLLISTALIFFEMFNYSTTDFALRDLLGDLRFFGIRWATTLSIAFCAIDFAGIARLFTPEDEDEPKEIWYLFGAWLLAATMNAALTWWGVSMAIVNHSLQSSAIISSNTIHSIVPVFVAVMVWVIRILIIGTISVAGSRKLWGTQRTRRTNRQSSGSRSGASRSSVSGRPVAASAARSVSGRPQRSSASGMQSTVSRPEPTYHSSFSDASEGSTSGARRF